jgi:hypothetical protein
MQGLHERAAMPTLRLVGHDAFHALSLGRALRFLALVGEWPSGEILAHTATKSSRAGPDKMSPWDSTSTTSLLQSFRRRPGPLRASALR